jgi:predicted nucleic acid-binding protein
MAICYFDSNAIVKWFHDEEGTERVKGLINQVVVAAPSDTNRIYIGALSLVEVPAAFSILERTNKLSRETRDELFKAFYTSRQDMFNVIPITNEILLDAAVLTQRYPLKGYDAVQLATVLDLQATLSELSLSIVFVSSDVQLLQAAQSEGLEIENPLSQPNEAKEPDET